MEVSARLSSKGQVTVPRAVREALSLNEGDRVVFRVEGRRAVLARTADLLALAGSVSVPAAKRGTPWADVLHQTHRARAATDLEPFLETLATSLPSRSKLHRLTVIVPLTSSFSPLAHSTSNRSRNGVNMAFLTLARGCPPRSMVITSRPGHDCNDLGIADNFVDPKSLWLTANDTTIYAFVNIDLFGT
jgi:AbrB family looped-hinge helix DNA binding protein